MSDLKTIEEVREEVIASTVNHVFSFSRNDMLALLSEHNSLRAQLAALKQIHQDNIDSENDWRAAAGEWDESDSLCIESAATVIERLRAQLAERDAKFQERGAILLECALLIRKFRDRSFRLREDTAEVVDAFYLSLPATAKANAKIIEAAEKHEAEHSAWSEMEARQCRVCQAVREKKEFNP